MIINIIDTEKPMFTCFSIGGNLDRELLKEKKAVTITATHETKTRVHTSLQVGNWRMGVNWEIDGFDTVAKTRNNFIDFKEVSVYYFKIKKNQGLTEYQEYIKEVVKLFLDNVGIELDEVTVHFINDVTWTK